MITKCELANLYSISRNTMSKRLRSLGIITRNMINPKQLEFIYEELGEPKNLAHLKQGAKQA